MSSREATGGYDPSGIDLDAWTVLEAELEATIPHYDRVNDLDDLRPRPAVGGRVPRMQHPA